MKDAWRKAFGAAWTEWRRSEMGAFAARVEALHSLHVIRRMAREAGADEETQIRMEDFIERALVELPAWQKQRAPVAPRKRAAVLRLIPGGKAGEAQA